MAFQQLVDAYQSQRNVGLLAPGGYGKTYLLNQFKVWLQENGILFAMTAMTGTAAIHLQGTTLHAWLGCGLFDQDAAIIADRIRNNPSLRKRWRRTQLLIIDEISMMSDALWDHIDVVARVVRGQLDKPMGGLQLLVSGDFLQLPPVEGRWVFTHRTWLDMDWVYIPLTEPKRFTDSKLLDILSTVRCGKELSDAQFQLLLDRHISKAPAPATAMVLVPTRVEAEKINQKNLKALVSPMFDIEARDSTAFTPAQLKRLDEMVPSIVQLKKGALVMLTRNIDLEKGLCNGATGIVVDINEFLQVQVQFAHGLEWIVPVQYDLIDYTRDGKTKSVGHRVQVPLVLSWALTIHKAQGTTIDSPTLMNLGDSVFAPAQAYVALSRVRRLDCLHFINISKSSLHADAQAVIYCTNNIKTLSA